ncbi:hypothetical protein [Chitinophaga sancti]|uniref:hypothetical protein n=1 Tax=Chitinophaga sancti TaxID=1004 RepID=UPI003F7B25EC
MYSPFGYGVEAMLAHEVGLHNMIRLNHKPFTDGSGNTFAYYPETRTLESNEPGLIMPTPENTKLLLNDYFLKRSAGKTGDEYKLPPLNSIK